ncbi:hypothetical protein [Streptomyces swartbergensis]|uniref:hypothetical protein n=1 Tax=Streptomyces swartbergensis TaxID=487165 RepID=UPI00382CB173
MPPLRGDESIVGVPEATVVDFWRFAMPGLRMNNTRGLFAEFLVHQAVGSHQPRVEWASRDVETDDGLRIEVRRARTCKPGVNEHRPTSASVGSVPRPALGDCIRSADPRPGTTAD